MKLLQKHHREQREWFSSMLRGLTPEQRKRAQEGYEHVYMEAYESEPVEHKKKNAAVRTANIRLRKFVERLRGEER